MVTGDISPRSQKLINECKQIQEDSTYTAEAHHLMAKMLFKKAYWCRLIPAVITVISTVILLLGAKDWVAWITLLSGIITIFNVLTESDKEAQNHIFAAKHFVVMKHKARSLHESFMDFMSEQEFFHAVHSLREQYNMLVGFVPIIDDDVIWEKARSNVRSGVHQPDFKGGQNA